MTVIVNGVGEFDGVSEVLGIKPFGKVEALKKVIHDNLNIDEHDQILISNGAVLENGHVVGSYDIKAGDVIYVAHVDPEVATMRTSSSSSTEEGRCPTSMSKSSRSRRWRSSYPMRKRAVRN